MTSAAPHPQVNYRKESPAPAEGSSNHNNNSSDSNGEKQRQQHTCVVCGDESDGWFWKHEWLEMEWNTVSREHKSMGNPFFAQVFTLASLRVGPAPPSFGKQKLLYGNNTSAFCCRRTVSLKLQYTCKRENHCEVDKGKTSAKAANLNRSHISAHFKQPEICAAPADTKNVFRWV
jgi:hypothetical protein